jgi:hypothetical protein
MIDKNLKSLKTIIISKKKGNREQGTGNREYFAIIFKNIELIFDS